MKKTKFLYTLILIILITSSNLVAAYYPPGGGGDEDPDRTYVRFRGSAVVWDDAGNPIENVKVTMFAMYFLYTGNTDDGWEGQIVSVSGYTNAYGVATLYKSVDVTNYYPSYYSFHHLNLRVTEPGYTTLSSNNNPIPNPVGTASFVVIHDENENGIRDEWELPLAQKFCPSLVLNDGDQGLSPKPVEIMLDNSDIHEEKISNLGQTWHNTYNWHPNHNYSDKHSYVGVNYSYFYHPDFPGDTPSEWFNFYHSVKNNYPNTIYVHFFLNDNNKPVIQYWFFYPFNDFLNNHEGDWEHINVIIDNQNPATASIIEVDYYFHHHVLTVNSPEVDFRLFDQTHPVVFVGGYSGVSDGWGSHGSYPTTGLWIAAAYDTRNDIEDGIYISEIVTSDGNYLKYNEFELTILPEPDVINYNTHPEMSWLSARLYWGELLVPSPGYEELEKLREKLRKIESITGGLIDYNLPNDVGNNPPWGPKWNAGWNHTGAVGEAFINYTQTPPQLTNWQPPY